METRLCQSPFHRLRRHHHRQLHLAVEYGYADGWNAPIRTVVDHLPDHCRR